MVTEDHLAAGLTGPMEHDFSALWLADNVGSFFEGRRRGSSTIRRSNPSVQNSCLGWATGPILSPTGDYNINGYTALYFAPT